MLATPFLASLPDDRLNTRRIPPTQISTEPIGALRDKLASAEEKIIQLRGESKAMERDLRQLASINEGLRRKLVIAEAVASAKNALTIRPPQRGKTSSLKTE